MSDRHDNNETPYSAPPVYSWRLIKCRLRLEGPISRPVPKRKVVEIALSELPHDLLAALQAEPTAASPPFRIGKRLVQIVNTGSDAGLLVHHTYKLRAEKRLKTYLNLLEEGIDALPEAFVLYDAQDRLLIANSQYAKLYPTIVDLLSPGVTFTEITKTAIERGQFQYDDSAEEWLNRRIAFHNRAEGFFEQHLDNGRWIQLSERRTNSGGITSIRADITLLKEREEALQRAKQQAERTSESLSRFLAMFSHEVSNGLNGLAGLAQILASETQTPTQKSNTDLMLQSTRRLTNVLSDLLDYLKNEAVGVAIRPCATSPQRILDTLKAELEPQAKNRNILLTWSVCKQVPSYVEVDTARILQVLANLAGNALKHASHTGEIAIRISTKDNQLLFEVKDDGIGIAPNKADELFDYFSQTNTKKSAGTGIGLAICKQLVIAMGGDIGVQSQQGQGSTFWFNVPLRIAAAPQMEQSGEQNDYENMPLRVGVIDDDPLNLKVAHALLTRCGQHAVIVENNEDIAEVIKTENLDILLLDLMMPKESGFEIAARIRAAPDNTFNRLIIIALTGNAIPDNLAACWETGIDAVLQKPLFIEQLHDALAWAASFDRTVSHAGPLVFAPLGLSTLSDTQDDATYTLRQLVQDLGVERFHESVQSARELIKRAAHINADNYEALRKYAHRVSGTASQLGFQRLSDDAHILETLLTPSSTTKPSIDTVEEKLKNIRTSAAGSLSVLEQVIKDSSNQLQRP